MSWYAPLLYLWAAPASLLGLLLVPLAILQGGRARIVHGVLEAYGGVITWFLRQGFPLGVSAAAMTLGHVVWGRDQQCLDDTREHERVHVSQYERWGPMFIPAYLFCSFYLKICGRNPYLDNPFEREAFEAAD